VAPEGFLWTVPVQRDGRPRLKVGVLARGPAAVLLQRFLARPEIRAVMGPVNGAPITRVLPLRPVPKSYRDRILLVGDAGGFTKPTTGGGIFYSLLTASLAADTLIEAFRAERFDETVLERYERRWHERLGYDLRVGDWLRQLLVKCSDAELERLVLAVAADDVRAVIRRTARFNWHRSVIVALLRQPSIARILFRSLLR
jgi:digeranylgeranylglycerophospholipid reductase